MFKLAECILACECKDQSNEEFAGVESEKEVFPDFVFDLFEEFGLDILCA